jgi:amidase
MTSHGSAKPPKIDNHHITRRSFLGTTAAGSAALLTGGLATLFKETALGGSSFPFVEATIPQLQAAMTNGQLTSRDLVLGYLQSIQSLNPTLHAVIETNPDAVSIAANLDNERKAGHVRGPLHGIPLLVKDNIATLDNMQTTAGSLALYNGQVPADAVIIQRLRAAGAIILGKSNLGEWANFRGFDNVYSLAVGWSARGGDTKTPTT